MTVTLYSTPTCPFCHQTREFLTNAGIVFTDYNVADDDVARGYMIEKSGKTAVPVIDIDGQIVVGFNEELLRALLHLT